MSKLKGNILIISDLHAPYQHRDALTFLKAVKNKYNIKHVKCVGDAIDNHSGSFHTIEYNTLSAKEEHEQAKQFMKKLHEEFPKMTMIIGNHSSMSYRKAKEACIPLDHIKSYNELYETPGWNWTSREFFELSNGQKCMIVHNMSSSTLNNAAKHSFCTIQGHFHSNFQICYYADADMIRWSMTTGCLIDTHSPAFNYGRGATINRPVLGCGAIINNKPILIPMVLNDNGRWNKKV